MPLSWCSLAAALVRNALRFLDGEIWWMQFSFHFIHSSNSEGQIWDGNNNLRVDISSVVLNLNLYLVFYCTFIACPSDVGWFALIRFHSLQVTLSCQKKLIPFSLQDHQVVGVHIISWISCLDLRTLAVLTNSTLSSSRFSLCVSHVFQ
jgi:hypothetical protein